MRLTRAQVTPEILRELLSCDYETGRLTWKKRRRKWFETDKGHAVWNALRAGKPAFTYQNKKGYLESGILGIKFLAHRVIWAHRYGSWPKNQIDHINGVENDNRIANLRDVTHQDNARNAKVYSHNSSGHTGVYWSNVYNDWRANIVVEGRICGWRNSEQGCSSAGYSSRCISFSVCNSVPIPTDIGVRIHAIGEPVADAIAIAELIPGAIVGHAFVRLRFADIDASVSAVRVGSAARTQGEQCNG